MDQRATSILYNLLAGNYVSEADYLFIKDKTEGLATGSGSYQGMIGRYKKVALVHAKHKTRSSEHYITPS